MEEMDKRDCLKDVQEYIKQNVDSTDKAALMQAIETAIKDNYILDKDVVEVLDYIATNRGGVCVSGERVDSKGYRHEPQIACEMSIWDKGGKCYDMIPDAVYKLKKKYAYMQQQKGGGGSADSDVLELGGASSVDSKEESKQPQRLEQQQGRAGSKKRGRAVKPFSDCIVVSDKLGLLEKLHQVLDDKAGKDVYLVINTLVSEGKIFQPTYQQISNEFGYIGSDSLKSKYSGLNAFESGEIEGVKKMFSAF